MDDELADFDSPRELSRERRAWFTTFDADLLITQYRARNTSLQLTREQRLQWSAEVVLVLQALIDELRQRAGVEDVHHTHRGEWNLSMRAGERPVTYKVGPERPAKK